jgi:predicted TIM-barrel fold metal-dependent hydrolase
VDEIIDAWMQQPTTRLLAHPMFEPLRRWTGGALPADEFPVAQTLAAMDAAGVSAGLITAWYGPEGPLISNDEVAEFVARADGRLVGVASVDIRQPVAAVAELRRAVNDLGCKALRVIPWLWGVPPNHRLFYPLYAECVQLDIPFCTQVGHTGPLRSSEPGRPIPYLDDVALEFPDLVIVGGHIGYPWTAEMVALATKYPNVYIDTSAYTVRHYPSELVEFLRRHGRSKVLFGTNYPMINPERALEGIGELDLDREASALFLGGNTSRVFHLPPR